MLLSATFSHQDLLEWKDMLLCWRCGHRRLRLDASIDER